MRCLIVLVLMAVTAGAFASTTRLSGMGMPAWAVDDESEVTALSPALLNKRKGSWLDCKTVFTWDGAGDQTVDATVYNQYYNRHFSWSLAEDAGFYTSDQNLGFGLFYNPEVNLGHSTNYHQRTDTNGRRSDRIVCSPADFGFLGAYRVLPQLNLGAMLTGNYKLSDVSYLSMTELSNGTEGTTTTNRNSMISAGLVLAADHTMDRDHAGLVAKLGLEQTRTEALNISLFTGSNQINYQDDFLYNTLRAELSGYFHSGGVRSFISLAGDYSQMTNLRADLEPGIPDTTINWNTILTAGTAWSMRPAENLLWVVAASVSPYYHQRMNLMTATDIVYTGIEYGGKAQLGTALEGTVAKLLTVRLGIACNAASLNWEVNNAYTEAAVSVFSVAFLNNWKYSAGLGWEPLQNLTLDLDWAAEPVDTDGYNRDYLTETSVQFRSKLNFGLTYRFN